MRTVRPLDVDVAAEHPDNTVINSRYTFYNFIFLNLYEQFRRPLNFYFLLVACLQFISVIAPVNPLSTLLPLLFAFTLTALKEGYDDVKRHRQDAAYNNASRRVLDSLTGQWQTRRNCTICVGDVILLRHDEEVPCDVVVVAAASNTVHIRTDNLDGELDLKPREVIVAHGTNPNNNEDDIDAIGVMEKPNSGDNSAMNPLAVHIDDNATMIADKLRLMRIECPPPSAIIESFDACAEFCSADGVVLERISLTHHHLLPQSSLLKNTISAVCVAVYTGDETKCGMNKRPAPVKWAKIDQDISRYSIFIFCCQMVSAFSFGLTGYLMNRRVEDKFWYLQVPSNELNASFFIYPLRFFLLTTVMIPVSFKFVVDMTKYYMAMTVEWDETMKHNGPEGEGCRVKNSNILEDLGQIDYILSDKTGTMTQNVMELLYVTVGNQKISLRHDTASGTNMDHNESSGSVSCSVMKRERKSSQDESVLHFGRVLSLCNAAEVVEGSDGEIMYQSSSPDEEALCRDVAQLGVRLLHRNVGEATLDVSGVKEEWIVHYTFPFSSELKSMGVIAEQKTSGDIYYFVKGADDRVLQMASSNAQKREETSTSRTSAQSAPPSLSHALIMSRLEEYAMQGLRTLLVAQKRLGREALHTFLREVRQAELSMQKRREALYELRLSMETSVTILGITAIEDKLQDDVHATVSDFLAADVKVWMLTGDKIQTAEQVGLSCGLYAAGDRLLRVLDEEGWEEKLMTMRPTLSNENETRPLSGSVLISQEIAHNADPISEDRLSCVIEKSEYHTMSQPVAVHVPRVTQAPQSRCVLVVQGGVVLERILSTPELMKRFAEVSEVCVSVICGRVTPSQKAAITNFVRASGFMTLAIGDGGNDVAMLQEAHVGIGIAGKEGQQAARAADFSITRFADLRALVFVHGHQAYTRTAYVIKYSFYKSMLICFIQLAYNIAGTYFSGGTFWNSLSLTAWNGLYTLPQTLFYCLDRVAPRTVLERHPFLYKATRHATDMNVYEFFVAFVLRGVVQSVAALWFVTSVYGPNFAYADTGGNASNDVTFSVAYSALIISQMLTLLLESHTITYLNALWIFGMPVLYVVLTVAYSSIPRLQYFGVWDKTMNVTSFLTAFGVAFALVLPAFALRVVQSAIRPDARDVLRTAALRNQMRRRNSRSSSYGRTLRLNRLLLCVPEEASMYKVTCRDTSSPSLDTLC